MCWKSLFLNYYVLLCEKQGLFNFYKLMWEFNYINLYQVEKVARVFPWQRSFREKSWLISTIQCNDISQKIWTIIEHGIRFMRTFSYKICLLYWKSIPPGLLPWCLIWAFSWYILMNASVVRFVARIWYVNRMS